MTCILKCVFVLYDAALNCLCVVVACLRSVNAGALCVCVCVLASVPKPRCILFVCVFCALCGYLHEDRTDYKIWFLWRCLIIHRKLYWGACESGEGRCGVNK